MAVLAAALAETVPVPLPLVSVRSVVSEFIQVTELVMSCCVLLFGKVASALNVTELLGAGVVVEAVRVIDVGVPALTDTVVVAGVMVPKAALTVVLHTPDTVAAGVSRPVLLIVAQVGVPELQMTLLVRSFVEPSLKVPVAVNCKVRELVMVWFCGPMAKDDNVGFTKKPVQPAAKPRIRSVADSASFCLELHITPKPLRRRTLETLLKRC